jgi:hypothetical protein
VQYLEMFRHAIALRPRVIVVSYYTGNDPYESVTMAYSNDNWTSLRPDANLDLQDKPRFPGFPSPASENWQARFQNSAEIVFTPTLRLVSNDTAHATVKAGYDVMARTALLMDTWAAQHAIGLVFTIIPTKELVYAERVRREGLVPSDGYVRLTSMEKENLDRLAETLKNLRHAKYVDVVQPLQAGALRNHSLYPADADGHPLAPAYDIMARAIAPAVNSHLAPSLPSGLVTFGAPKDERSRPYILLTKDGIRSFANNRLILDNGWRLQDARVVDIRDLIGLRQMGMIQSVDRKRFGPQSADMEKIKR